MRVTTVLLALIAIACSQPSKPGSAAGGWLPPADSSSHTQRFITVAAGVRLEVLDWGGSGDPVVFLSGLSNNAHVFDEFAPEFVDRHHVLAITRRGFGASSRAPSGYDVATRVADLLAVLDSLHLDRTSLVGHSVAGGELTGFASRHPDRVKRLVYLDAAYDGRELKGAPEEPPGPAPTPADSASPTAFRDWGFRGFPIAEILWQFSFDSTGRVVGPTTADSVQRAILDGLEEPSYSAIKAPALAIYNRWEHPWSLTDSLYYSRFDERTKAATVPIWHWAQAYEARSRDRFRRGVQGSQVLELENATHYVFISNRSAVIDAIRAFLDK